MGGRVVVRSAKGLRQEIETGQHHLVADEPPSAGGADAGPDPYAYLLAALGTCTSMTLLMYARRKGWPLESVQVELEHDRVYEEDCANCEQQGRMIERIRRKVVLDGPLSGVQIARLEEIARRCPVHRTLAAGLRVVDDVQSVG